MNDYIVNHIPQPEIYITLTCANCGKQIASGLKKTETTRIREPRYYCSECYYSIIEKNKQYRIRNNYLEKKIQEKIQNSKELRQITKTESYMYGEH